MLKHIVMWKLQDEALGTTKEENAKQLKVALEALKKKIPEIIHIEAGINILSSDLAADVVLYSEFESIETLKTYQTHPAHIEVANFVKKIVTERHVIDYLA